MPLTWDEDKGGWAGGPAVSNVAGSAGGTYTATEQGIINSLVTQLNALLAGLRDAGIIAND